MHLFLFSFNISIKKFFNKRSFGNHCSNIHQAIFFSVPLFFLLTSVVLMIADTYMPTCITINSIWHKCDDCEAEYYGIFHIIWIKDHWAFLCLFLPWRFSRFGLHELEIQFWRLKSKQWDESVRKTVSQPLPSSQPAFLWLTQLIRNFKFLNNATFSFIREMRVHRSWDIKVLFINIFWYFTYKDISNRWKQMHRCW